MSNTLLLLLFTLQLIALYFISIQTTKELFTFFFRFLPERGVFIAISLIFLPGTIVHELSHFIMAIILLLKVKQVSIWPEFDKKSIKLGKVTYIKRDVFSSIIVGIAPIIVGLLLFWLLSSWHLFPNPNIWITLVVGYFIFVISTTMFSSKQDLIDIIYIVPVIIILAGVLYVFNINPALFVNSSWFFKTLSLFIKQLNYYFLFSFIIHLGIIILLKVFRSIKK